MKRLSRRKRDEGSRWLLQPRDIRVLEALRTVRYLSTSQVKRAFFPECRNDQTTRRRLRALFDLGLTGRIAPLVQVGQGSPSEVHFLEQAGVEHLRGKAKEKGEVGDDGLELESVGVRPRFLEHSLAVSELWVCLQRALAMQPPVILERFVADFEIRARQRQGDRTYWLLAGQELVVPDAVLILRGVGEFAGVRRLVFCEADRGSEALRVIERKVAAYARLRQEKGYLKLGMDLEEFRVLFLTTSEERARNIRRQTRGKSGDEVFWVTGESLSDRNILTEPVWIDDKGEQRSMMKRRGK